MNPPIASMSAWGGALAIVAGSLRMKVMYRISASSPSGHLLAQAMFLFEDLGARYIGEVFRLEDLADLDLPLVAGRVRHPLHPLDRLFLRFYLDEPEAGDQFLRLGERAVDDRALVPGKLHAGALRARMQPLAGQHDTRLRQLLVEPPHLGEQLLARHDPGLGVPARLHQ